MNEWDVIKQLRAEGLLERTARLVDGEKVISYEWSYFGRDMLEWVEQCHRELLRGTGIYEEEE